MKREFRGKIPKAARAPDGSTETGETASQEALRVLMRPRSFLQPCSIRCQSRVTARRAGTACFCILRPLRFPGFLTRRPPPLDKAGNFGSTVNYPWLMFFTVITRMLHRSLKWLGCGLLLATSTAAAANKDFGWFFRSWKTNDGLPVNSVSGVTQTSDGRLWVATHGGVVAFDGVRFREVELKAFSGGDPPIIRCMVQGGDNRLWLAMEGGRVISIDTGSGRQQVFSAAQGLPYSRPISMAVADDQSVWVSYSDGLACRIAGDKVMRFPPKAGFEGRGKGSLAKDLEGNIWFAKDGQLGLLDGTGGRGLFTLPPGTTRLGASRKGGVWVCSGRALLRVEGSATAPVAVGEIPDSVQGIEPSVVFEDGEGTVWVGTTSGGLYRFDGLDFDLVETSHPDVLALAEDHEGNLWVGTEGGGIDRIRKRMLELHGSDDGLPVSTLRSICEDGNGVMWAAAQNGELLRFVDRRWQSAASGQGWTGERALCVTGDGNHGVWVGTSHGGLHHWDGAKWTAFHREDGLAGDVVLGLLSDSRGDLWVALDEPNIVQRLRNGKFQSFVQPAGSRAVRAMAEDARGGIWFGTLDGFLLRAEGEDLLNETPRDMARPGAVRCLLPDADGGLWIGYAGTGLGRLKDGSFKQITKAEGLPDNYISAMAFDFGGNVWFANDWGIFRVQQAELDAVANGEADHLRAIACGLDEGLPDLQANYGYWPGSARSRNGLIWFPMRTGLAIVHPGRVVPRSIPLGIALETVSVDGLAIPHKSTESLRLQPHHRRMDFEFTAFSFVAPESIEFRYRLDGLDKEWSEGENRRNVSYSRLPAGKYAFRVAARARNGEWSERGASVAFTVEPFLWQRWWFRAAALGAFTLGVVAVVRHVSFRPMRLKMDSLEKDAALSRERARIAKDIHDDLGASLTQISLLSKLAHHDLDQQDKAASHLSNIASAARAGVKAVDEIVWAVNPRHDSVEHLLDYAGQFAVDFLRNAGLRCRVDFPPHVPPLELASEARHSLYLLVKESLNNIVKHAGASEVLLRAEVGDGLLTLHIEDDGTGFEQAPDNAFSDGLHNMRERLLALGGSFRITSAPGRGTSVTAQLPLAGALSSRSGPLEGNHL